MLKLNIVAYLILIVLAENYEFFFILDLYLEQELKECGQVCHHQNVPFVIFVPLLDFFLLIKYNTI